MVKTAIAVILVITVSIGLMVYIMNRPNRLSYDIIWENTAQGLTYYCSQANATSIICRTFECYNIGPQKFCRDLGFNPIGFSPHD